MPRRRICGAMILLIASVACGRDPRERPSEYYPTHANAVAADAVLRGFVPGWVPPSATDIHAQADLDSGDQCLAFSLPADAIDALRQTLTELSVSETENLYPDCPFEPSWWFQEGLIQHHPANDNAFNADLYAAPPHSPSRRLVVAIERGGSRVFAWSR